MTTKEKAESIFHQMYKILWHTNAEPIHCKECALIAVDEIEKALTDYGRGDSFQLQNMDSEFRYWDKVKKEIEKL
jgi:hypothetical protein